MALARDPAADGSRFSRAVRLGLSPQELSQQAAWQTRMQS